MTQVQTCNHEQLRMADYLLLVHDTNPCMCHAPNYNTITGEPVKCLLVSKVQKCHNHISNRNSVIKSFYNHNRNKVSNIENHTEYSPIFEEDYSQNSTALSWMRQLPHYKIPIEPIIQRWFTTTKMLPCICIYLYSYLYMWNSMYKYELYNN